MTSLDEINDTHKRKRIVMEAATSSVIVVWYWQYPLSLSSHSYRD